MENHQIPKKNVGETYKTLGLRQKARESLVEMKTEVGWWEVLRGVYDVFLYTFYSFVSLK